MVLDVLAWAMLILAGVVGTMMVVVGMLEELPSIVRAAWNRSLRK